MNSNYEPLVNYLNHYTLKSITNLFEDYQAIADRRSIPLSQILQHSQSNILTRNDFYLCSIIENVAFEYLPESFDIGDEWKKILPLVLRNTKIFDKDEYMIVNGKQFSFYEYHEFFRHQNDVMEFIATSCLLCSVLKVNSKRKG